MSDTMLIFASLASAAVDAAAAGLVLGIRPVRLGDEAPARMITPSRFFVAILIAGIVCFVKFPLWRELGVNPFGVMKVLYVDLVVAMPLVALAVLLGHWLRRRRSTRVVVALSLLCLAAAPIGAYASWIEPYRLRVETADIPLRAERAGSDAVRIVVLADIQTDHVTGYERRALQRAMDLKGDVIVLPGDLFHGSKEDFERELPHLRAMLAELSAPGGVYMVQGNMDDPDRMRRVVEGTNVRFLMNEMVRVTVNGRRLTVAGTDWDCRTDAGRDVVRRLQNAPGDGDVRILLVHSPDAVRQLEADSRVDLVIAGHTHGGQVSLPLVGPLMTASKLPRRVTAGGYHELGGRRLYISRGVGLERGQAPRVRFLCPPEISLLTLSDTK